MQKKKKKKEKKKKKPVQIKHAWHGIECMVVRVDAHMFSAISWVFELLSFDEFSKGYRELHRENGPLHGFIAGSIGSINIRIERRLFRNCE